MPSVCAVHRRPIDIIFGKKGNTKTKIRPKAFLVVDSSFQVLFEKVLKNENF